MNNLKIVFFGTPEFSVAVLRELYKKNIVPTLLVTAPDANVGRGLVLTSPPVKIWGKQHGIDVLQNHNDKMLLHTKWDLFIVASYGKILPADLLRLPRKGVLNVHPSLLPKFRGASPIVSAILADEKETGVSIMLLDEKMDHGPIVAQATVEVDNWPPKASVLEDILVSEGGKLLAEVIFPYMKGEITPEEQDHDKATYTKKITKEDGLLDLADNDYRNFLKIQALDTYFFINNKRIKVTDAEYVDDELVITRVIPEGKKEMKYADFLRGQSS